MILDNLMLFTGTSNGASGGITSTAYTDAPTTGTEVASNVLDIGITDGIPNSAAGAGARDLGVTSKFKLLAQVTVAFTVGTSLQLLLAGAPDDGSGGQGSYTTMWTSFAYTEANLDVGAQLANIGIPRVVPGQTALPRFLRLSFITVGTHTLGQVMAGVVLDRFDQIQGVDAALSGYRAGINVAN